MVVLAARSLIGSAILVIFVLVWPVPVAAQRDEPILVLPFRNLSPQPTDSWIGIGIADSLAVDLENMGLSVLAGPGVNAALELVNSDTWVAGEQAIVAAGQTVGARWVITGAYQRAGDLLRLTPRLVDVETASVRRGFKVDGPALDLFRLQDQVVALLGEVLIPTRRAETQVPDPSLPSPTVSPAAAPTPLEGRESTAAAIGALDEASARLAHTAEARRSGYAAVLRGDRPVATIGRTADPPRIDGRLDDAVWETAAHLTEFTQIAPVEGAPGTDQTEVWMAYDSDNMYFAFHAHYTDPGMIRINRADRDDIRGDDQMTVLFDPFLDQQRAYQFEVNGYGVQADSLVNADGSTGGRSSSMSSQAGSSGTASRRRSSGSGLGSSGALGIRGDDSWNALFDTGGQLVEDGWTAEMAIPFKSLRYPARDGGDPHRWGFQITRRIRGKSEAQSWSPVSRAVAGQLTQFGVLEGLENLSQSRNLEILPELTE